MFLSAKLLSYCQNFLYMREKYENLTLNVSDKIICVCSCKFSWKARETLHKLFCKWSSSLFDTASHLFPHSSSLLFKGTQGWNWIGDALPLFSIYLFLLLCQFARYFSWDFKAAPSKNYCIRLLNQCLLISHLKDLEIFIPDNIQQKEH